MLYSRISLFLVTLLIPLLIACSHSPQAHSEDDSHYTCPMHPQIVQEAPGTCPICHMDLVKVQNQAADSTGKRSPVLTLSAEQVRLANIRTDTLRYGKQTGQVLFTGTLRVDASRTETISSRVAGRIERLYFKENGEAIQRGAPLYQVYSEGLQTFQNEYLLALAQKKEVGDPQGRYSRMVEATTQKLLLLGMTQAQVAQLGHSGKAGALVTFFANQSGVIQDITVTEGSYVGEGSPLFSLADLSSLWVEAQLYPAETAGLRPGREVEVAVEGLSGPPLSGKVDFLNPELERESKIVLARVRIPNQGGVLLPGMQANVWLKTRQTGVLSLPLTAVIRDSQGSYVWRQTGENRFEVRRVETGAESSRSIQVTSGVEPGDRVVVTGAYLLHSEYILRNGADPMAGHDPSGMQM